MNDQGMTPEDQEYCRRCVYRKDMGMIKVCDYLLITGHPRGCPPGVGCTKEKTGRRRRPMIPHFSENGGF